MRKRSETIRSTQTSGVYILHDICCVGSVFVHGLHGIHGGVSGNHAGTQGVSRRREGNGRLSAYSRLSSTACLRQVVRRRHTACGLGATRPEPAWHHKATQLIEYRPTVVSCSKDCFYQIFSLSECCRRPQEWPTRAQDNAKRHQARSESVQRRHPSHRTYSRKKNKASNQSRLLVVCCVWIIF